MNGPLDKRSSTNENIKEASDSMSSSKSFQRRNTQDFKPVSRKSSELDGSSSNTPPSSTHQPDKLLGSVDRMK